MANTQTTPSIALESRITSALAGLGIRCEYIFTTGSSARIEFKPTVQLGLKELDLISDQFERPTRISSVGNYDGNTEIEFFEI